MGTQETGRIPTVEGQISDLIKEIVPYSGIIAIDGPGGAGKGALAKTLSHLLNLEQCSAGDMYRAITYYFMKILRINPTKLSDMELAARLTDFSINLDTQDGKQHVLITSSSHNCDKKDVTDKIHTPTIDQCISPIAKRDPVRDVVSKKQSEMFEKGNVVMEGRDMWKIAANATVRIYVYADDEVLVDREVKRQTKRGIKLSREEAEKMISARNKEDQARVGRGKLLTPQEAWKSGRYDLVIDTSKMLLNEVVLEVLQKLKAVKDHDSTYNFLI